MVHNCNFYSATLNRKGVDFVFWNRRALFRGSSSKRYNEIRNILELNNIKYTLKIENKNKDK